MNKAPLTHISLHPRVGAQQYKGAIDKDAFREFKENCIHPVIYNGDILTVEDIQALETEFSDLEGVMIGRGLLARPTLAWEYKNGKRLTDVEVLQKIKLLHSRMLEHYERIIPTDPQRLNKIRTFWDFMENTLGRKNWKKIEKAGNMKNYLIACNI